MSWIFLPYLLALSYAVLLVLLFQSRKKLHLATGNRKAQGLQGSFYKAITDIGNDLERERANSALFIQALESIEDGVALLDRAGCIKFANSSLWKHYAVQPGQIRFYMGSSWIDLYTEKGQKEIRASVLPVVDRKGIWTGESDIKTLDGTLKRVSLHISKIESGYIGFIRDITDLHNAEQDCQNLSIQLHELQKSDAVERVVKALVHEFNNSLSPVGAYAEMLLEDLPKGSETYEYAEKIYHSSQIMRGLLEQTRLLLPGSRQAASQKTNITSLVPIVVGDLKKAVSSAFRVKTEILLKDAFIPYDMMRLNQLLFHLLKNAVEAGNADQPVELRIDCYKHDLGGIKDTNWQPCHRIEQADLRHVNLHFGTYNPETDYFRIKIKDMGGGITRDIMDHILEPFFTTKRMDAKSGLGMSIVKSVIQDVQGYLFMESIGGEGTVATVLLPVKRKAISGSHSTREAARTAG